MRFSMQDLKAGDVIVFQEGQEEAVREEVLGRLENLVFTRRLFSTGAVGSPNGPQLIEDLITFGFNKEER